MSAIKQKPDFSGEWKLNRQASVLSPVVASAVQGGALKIEHRAQMFASHLRIDFADKPVESTFELPPDGGKIVADHEGQRIVSSLRWDGEALLAVWRIQSSVSELAITFRYELTDDSRRLHASEQLRGGGRDQDNLWVFDRS